jgi:pimeloyl-ACP methyl ester carboxylesterase
MPIILHPATPWIFAGIVLVIGLLLWRGSRRRLDAARWARAVPGAMMVLAGCVLLVGAGVSATKQASARAAWPAPGRLVDVGGYRLHVLCEGPRTPRTVVWLAGSYGQALWIQPSHAEMARTNRSCIIDRGGLGWSDVGPFPRSVNMVNGETRAALLAAGEKAPFVLVGQSFGGLYAANFAHRYPKDVAGLVLLDPTAPGWIALSGAEGCPPGDGSPLAMFGTMFGLAYVDALNPLRSPAPNPERDRLGAERWEQLVAWELRPAARWSARSAMDEVCRNFYAIVRTPGALGSVPMLLIPQTPDLAQQIKYAPPGLGEAERRNYFQFMRHVSTEMAAMSSRSQIVFAPKGATHMFLDTRPDFTMAQVRGFLASLDAAPATP